MPQRGDQRTTENSATAELFILCGLVLNSRKYLHQACLESGSICFVWDKPPLTEHAVQDCVHPTPMTIKSIIIPVTQHDTRQHRTVSYIGIQLWFNFTCQKIGINIITLVKTIGDTEHNRKHRSHFLSLSSNITQKVWSRYTNETPNSLLTSVTDVMISKKKIK